MNRILIGVVFAMAATGVRAEDLLCEGTSYHRLGSSEDSTVVQFDSSTLKLGTSTRNGWAEGNVQPTPKLYKGHLYTASGDAYWINLNRYTGEFTLVPTKDGTMADKVEFVGACRRAERQF